MKRIPGTLAAYGVLLGSGLLLLAALAAALWLTGRGALWLGRALPHPLS